MAAAEVLRSIRSAFSSPVGATASNARARWRILPDCAASRARTPRGSRPRSPRANAGSAAGSCRLSASPPHHRPLPRYRWGPSRLPILEEEALGGHLSPSFPPIGRSFPQETHNMLWVLRLRHTTYGTRRIRCRARARSACRPYLQARRISRTRYGRTRSTSRSPLRRPCCFRTPSTRPGSAWPPIPDTAR